MRKLNIAICCFASIGGSGVVATELGKGLAKLGHHIHFVCSDIPYRLEDLTGNIHFHQVHSFPYPAISAPQYDLALASRLAEVIDEQDIDIVHCHYAVPHAISAFLAKQIIKNKKVKFITTLHGTDTSLVGLHPCYYGITKFAIEAADGVTAVSKWLADQSQKDFNIPYPTVLRNSVDTNRFTPDNYSENYKHIFSPNGEKVLLHVSNMRSVKRICDIIRIFKEVHDALPSHLCMVGEGPDKKAAEELAYNLNLSNHVTFLGATLKIENLYAVADLFILASEQESFGLAALEALSSGTPVIAYNIGGLSEVVLDSSGKLTPFKDISLTAKNAIQILENDETLKNMSTAARKVALDHYKEEEAIYNYEEYYFKIIDS